MSNDGDFLRLCLQWTLLPDTTRQQGEMALLQLEHREDFGPLLVSIIDDPSCALDIRAAAAGVLNNYIRKCWPEPHKAQSVLVPAATCDYLKQELVPLMYRVPQIIQQNISETITGIAKIDFPTNWPALITDLTARFDAKESDIDAILASLRTAHGHFKHYRVACKSPALVEEILHVVDKFATKFTMLFEGIIADIPNLKELSREDSHATVTLIKAFHVVLFCCKIYHSLIFQGFPELFIQNFHAWISNFNTLLYYENSDLRADNDDEPGVLRNIQSEICDILTLLAVQYDVAFDPYAAQFVQSVVTLTTKATPWMQDDQLVLSSMEFLSAALAQDVFRNVFNGKGLLEAVCEQIILPNMQLRPSDTDDFDSQPEECIRRDIEDSDIPTRRRAAAGLVRAAMIFHEKRVTDCLLACTEKWLSEYQKDSHGNWQMKVCAIFLTMALAAKEQRPRLPVEMLVSFFPAVVRHLESPYTAVHTYAAHCLERLLSLKERSTGRLRLTPHQLPLYLGALDRTASLNPLPPRTLFSHLLACRWTSPPDDAHPRGRLDENEYAMKCTRTTQLLATVNRGHFPASLGVMRALSFFQWSSEMGPHLMDIVPQLLQRMDNAIIASTTNNPSLMQNPGNARYAHYVFESTALCIRIACRERAPLVQVLEQGLLAGATVVLQKSVEACVPYVLQLLAQLLESRAGSGDVPADYLLLLDRLALLYPASLRGNEALLPSLVRLVGAYFQANAQQVVGQLKPALGLFKMLVTSQKYDHEGFNLLRPIIDNTPRDSLQEHLAGIFTLFFQRLQYNLVPTLYLMVVRLGTAAFISSADTVQPNIFAMLLDRIMLPEVLKVQRRLPRKLCIVGCVALLTDTVHVLDGVYDSRGEFLLMSILEACVKLTQRPPEKENVEDAHSFEVARATAPHQLVFARKAEGDYVSGVVMDDSQKLLATQLASLTLSRPETVRARLHDCSVPEVRKFVDRYCPMASVTLT
ncbi:exportin-2-like [Paramacrobiotus metropolitanus]|uniref:exportin-2-like n=1 Tax=Paramacrobiotus metropolitanus TaxID=2943436 RepID=UPI0024463112|nr:exportin-2-like [Paramacrobiotus metropolitanus]